MVVKRMANAYLEEVLSKKAADALEEADRAAKEAEQAMVQLCKTRNGV